MTKWAENRCYIWLCRGQYILHHFAWLLILQVPQTLALFSPCFRIISYDVNMIWEARSERQRCFCHAFTDCDTVPLTAGHGKLPYLTSLVQEILMSTWMTSLTGRTTKDTVIRSDITIFKYIHQVLFWEKVCKESWLRMKSAVRVSAKGSR